MIILISKLIFFLSLLGLFIILLRKIPELNKLPNFSITKKTSLKSLPKNLKKTAKIATETDFFQNIIIAGLEKSLRRFKVTALKIDNKVDSFLRRLKK